MDRRFGAVFLWGRGHSWRRCTRAWKPQPRGRRSSQKRRIDEPFPSEEAGRAHIHSTVERSAQPQSRHSASQPSPVSAVLGQLFGGLFSSFAGEYDGSHDTEARTTWATLYREFMINKQGTTPGIKTIKNFKNFNNQIFVDLNSNGDSEDGDANAESKGRSAGSSRLRRIVSNR